MRQTPLNILGPEHHPFAQRAGLALLAILALVVLAAAGNLGEIFRGPISITDQSGKKRIVLGSDGSVVLLDEDGRERVTLKGDGNIHITGKIQSDSGSFNAVPVGSILAFYGTSDSVPEGYLPCNGQAFTKEMYPQLFDLLCKSNPRLKQSDHVANTPDLRGEFLRGLDDGRSLDPNRLLGSVQADALKSHSHSLNRAFGVMDGWDLGSTGKPGHHPVASPGDGGEKTVAVLPSGESSETRPRNLAVYFIIKSVS